MSKRGDGYGKEKNKKVTIQERVRNSKTKLFQRKLKHRFVRDGRVYGVGNQVTEQTIDKEDYLVSRHSWLYHGRSRGDVSVVEWVTTLVSSVS